MVDLLKELYAFFDSIKDLYPAGVPQQYSRSKPQADRGRNKEKSETDPGAAVEDRRED